MTQELSESLPTTPFLCTNPSGPRIASIPSVRRCSGGLRQRVHAKYGKALRSRPQTRSNRALELDVDEGLPVGIENDPPTGLAPTGLHLGNAEQAVAVLADEFGAVPLEEVARRAADAFGRVERVQAVLAAVFLVGEGPAQAEE